MGRARGHPQDIGTEFEERFAERIGGEAFEGSGRGRFVKGDVRGDVGVFSCKSTKYNSFSVTRYMLDEARQIARYMGGVPGMAIECGGHVVVMHELGDYLDILADDSVAMSRSKADAKKARIRARPLER